MLATDTHQMNNPNTIIYIEWAKEHIQLVFVLILIINLSIIKVFINNL